MADRKFTKAELRGRAQVLADDENGQIATTSQYNDWLDEAWGLLWDQLVLSGVYPQVEQYTLTIGAAGSGGYTGDPTPDRGIEALASDHYCLINIHYEQDTDHWRELERINPQDIRRYLRGNAPSRRYMLYGDGVAEKSRIRLFPQPDEGDVYQILYVPTPYLLASESTEIPSFSAWADRFIVIDVAMKARMKEESGIRDLQAERNVIFEQIQKSQQMRALEAMQYPERPGHYDGLPIDDPATRRW